MKRKLGGGKQPRPHLMSRYLPGVTEEKDVIVYLNVLQESTKFKKI